MAKPMNMPKMGGVVKPAVKSTARLSAPVQGTRMKKNMADDMGRAHCNMPGSAKY